MTYIYKYIIFINLITFIIFSLDKNKARKNKWRIPESTLIFLSIIGGSLGGLLSMKLFNHKTKKQKFTLGIPLLLIINLLIFYYIKYYIF